MYDTYRLEMDRILNRKNNISTRTLRQNRATALLRTEVKEFVPKMNRDIDAESYATRIFFKYFCNFIHIGKK